MPPPTPTLTYTRLHRAFMDAASRCGVTPTTVRVLLAVHDRGGTVKSLELYDDLGGEGSRVRHALLEAYDAGLADGTGPGGGRRKRGNAVDVQLTPTGRALLTGVLEAVQGLEAAA